MKTLLTILTATLLGIQSAEAAKVYTCTVNGQTVYTTSSSGNCHSADLPPIGKYSSSRYDASDIPPAHDDVSSSAKTKKSPAPAKAVAKNTAKPPVTQAQNTPPAPAPQKSSGSSSRRSILETELSNERKALSDAQKSLAQARVAKDGSVNRQQIDTLQNNVLDRQQNIQALQRELSRM